MQQELIEMLEKMVKYFDEIPSDSYYYRETASILNEAEKLVEKAKNSVKEPAVPQGEPVYQLARATGPVADAWIDVAKDVYDDAGFHPSDFKRRILYAAPSQPVTLTLTRYRVWPDGTVQDYSEGNPYAWKSDDYALIDAESPEQAIIAALREKEGK